MIDGRDGTPPSFPPKPLARFHSMAADAWDSKFSQGSASARASGQSSRHVDQAHSRRMVRRHLFIRPERRKSKKKRCWYPSEIQEEGIPPRGPLTSVCETPVSGHDNGLEVLRNGPRVFSRLKLAIDNGAAVRWRFAIARGPEIKPRTVALCRRAHHQHILQCGI